MVRPRVGVSFFMILRKPLAITESRQAFVDDATNTDEQKKKAAKWNTQKGREYISFRTASISSAETCGPCDRLPRKPSTLRLPFQPLRQNRMFRSRRVTPSWPWAPYARVSPGAVLLIYLPSPGRDASVYYFSAHIPSYITRVPSTLRMK